MVHQQRNVVNVIIKKWNEFMDKVNSEYSETKRQGVHLLIATITAIVSYIVANILLMIAGANFLLALCEAIVGLILIGSVIAVIIRIFLLLVNVIKDIFSLPGKAIKKAKEVKAQKEREQAEAELQAKITEGIASYKTEADSGNAEAMRQVAKVYSTYGKDSIAISWYTKAAQLGDIEAQLTLAGKYKVIGAIEAKKWLSEVEKNPKAGPEQKEAARVKKIDIEQYEFRQAAEAEAAERRRRTEAEMIEQQKKLPMTGDFYAMRSYSEECVNVGKACAYCARRDWHGKNWGIGYNCGFH